MRILVFNSGSSSLKFQLFKCDATTPVSILQGTAHDLDAEANCDWIYNGKRESTTIVAGDHDDAARHILDLLENGTVGGQSLLDGVTAIGHRIVHGGSAFSARSLCRCYYLTQKSKKRI